jgi:hypothetical protein
MYKLPIYICLLNYDFQWSTRQIDQHRAKLLQLLTPLFNRYPNPNHINYRAEISV